MRPFPRGSSGGMESKPAGAGSSPAKTEIHVEYKTFKNGSIFARLIATLWDFAVRNRSLDFLGGLFKTVTMRHRGLETEKIAFRNPNLYIVTGRTATRALEIPMPITISKRDPIRP